MATYYISDVSRDSTKKITTIKFQHVTAKSYKFMSVPYSETNSAVIQWGFRPLMGDILNAKVELELAPAPDYSIKSVKKLESSSIDPDLPLEVMGLKPYPKIDVLYTTERVPENFVCPDCGNQKAIRNEDGAMYSPCKNLWCMNRTINESIPHLPPEIANIPVLAPPYYPSQNIIFSGITRDFKRWLKLVALYALNARMVTSANLGSKFKMQTMNDFVDKIKKDEWSISSFIPAYTYHALIYTSLEGSRVEEYLYGYLMERIEHNRDSKPFEKRPIWVNIPGYPDSIRLKSLESFISNNDLRVV